MSNGYPLLGFPVLGNIVVFLIDPVNEVMGLFMGNPARLAGKRQSANISIASSFIVPNISQHFGVSFYIIF